MLEFSGSLTSEELPSLVRYLWDLGQTGYLELMQPGWSARVGFCDGRIVNASLGRERGLAAMLALKLVMEQASFVYTEGSEPLEQDLDLTVDEFWQLFQRSARTRAVTLDAVPNRASLVDAPAQDLSAMLPRRAATTYLAIDHRRSVREIIGDADLAAGLRSIAQLLDLGLIAL